MVNNSKEYSRNYYRGHKDSIKTSCLKWNRINREHFLEIRRNVNKRFRQSLHGKALISIHQARRKRKLPTRVILGTRLENYELAHLTPEIAIFLPKKIHRKIRHSVLNGLNMPEHISYVISWLKINNPTLFHQLMEVLK